MGTSTNLTSTSEIMEGFQILIGGGWKIGKIEAGSRQQLTVVYHASNRHPGCARQYAQLKQLHN